MQLPLEQVATWFGPAEQAALVQLPQWSGSTLVLISQPSLACWLQSW